MEHMCGSQRMERMLPPESSKCQYFFCWYLLESQVVQAKYRSLYIFWSRFDIIAAYDTNSKELVLGGCGGEPS